MILGYTTGVFDLYNIGHLQFLKKAREECDRLVVGITDDELLACKGLKPIIPFGERSEIIRNNRCVDAVIPQYSYDLFLDWEKLRFNVLFVGDELLGSHDFEANEGKLRDVGVTIRHFSYTQGVSSQLILDILKNYQKAK